MVSILPSYVKAIVDVFTVSNVCIRRFVVEIVGKCNLVEPHLCQDKNPLLDDRRRSLLRQNYDPVGVTLIVDKTHTTTIVFYTHNFCVKDYATTVRMSSSYIYFSIELCRAAESQLNGHQIG